MNRSRMGRESRVTFARPPITSPRSKPKKAPEGLLLVVLLISVLLVVMSLMKTRSPAAGVFTPIAETGN